MKRFPGLSLAAAMMIGLTGGALAQTVDIKVRLWELPIGTHVTELPPEYLDPHCGTNGGPQSRRLDGWADYMICPAEAATGFHEIWFTEDDEAEYVARAYRSQLFDPGPAAANVLVGHKMIYSLLVDDGGFVQGYRIVTDPRESESYRYTAEVAGQMMQGLYGYGNFTCIDEPLAEGETDVDGRFLKRTCVAETAGVHVTIERRFLRKPGQTAIDPLTGRATVGYFESSTRLEVIALDHMPD